MSFYSSNKNFIHIKLLSEMKGLSDEEMFSQYESIKPETRKRLKKAYLSADDLCNFYEEAFEHVLFFEQELLIVNLFFEKECNQIFNYLRFGKLSELEINKGLLFPYKFIDYMTNNSSEDEVASFLKIELTEGGHTPKGRNNGAKLVNTPYILFMDADSVLQGSQVIT